MTKQEIFDTVCTHLAKQKRRAVHLVNGAPHCDYKSTNGDMCAIGCLLNDDEHKEVDGSVKTIGGLIREGYLSSRPFFAKYENLLRSLQKAHDLSGTASTAQDLRDSLSDVALVSGLNPEAAEQITVWNG